MRAIYKIWRAIDIHDFLFIATIKDSKMTSSSALPSSQGPDPNLARLVSGDLCQSILGKMWIKQFSCLCSFVLFMKAKAMEK